jgi:hypothetical protein
MQPASPNMREFGVTFLNAHSWIGRDTING